MSACSRPASANAARAKTPCARSALRAVLALAVLALVACAPTRDPWGREVSRGRAPEPLVLPDSLQADLSVSPKEAGSPPFTARLYARPRKDSTRAYRLDAYGLTSVIASYRWLDGSWLLVRHDERRYWKGEGNSLEVEGAPLRLPDVHAVLGFVWGDLLPGFPGPAPGDSGLVRWTYAGENWEAAFDPVTGLCREARSPSLRLKYGRYRTRGGRGLPTQVEIYVDGAPVVTLRLGDNLSTRPDWKKNPFLLPVPPSYTPGG